MNLSIYICIFESKYNMKPGLYIFHPACEISIANPYPYFNIPKLIHQFEQDLSILPYFLAQKNDAVLLDKLPSQNFLEYLSSLGFPGAQFITYSEYKNIASNYELNPWCYSPFLKEKLDALSDNNFYHEIPAVENLIDWQSKVNSLDFCKQILQKQTNFFIPPEKSGHVFSQIAEIENFIRIEKNVVLKAPISSSGRGNLFIRNAQINDYQRSWIKSFLGKQKYIVAETYWNKKLDLAAEFYKQGDTINFIGYSFFETNSNGFYQSNMLHYSLEDFYKIYPSIELEKWVQIIKDQLLNNIAYVSYNGYLGVDAMVVENRPNEYLLHPCNEINARQTMGLIACFLERYIHPTSKGRMLFYSSKEKNFASFCDAMSKKHAMIFKEKKALSGFFPLTEPTENAIFGAYMLLD